ncbi:hypothetical protein [Herbiconiux daphne]|uniref:Mucin-associated surface protein n=1 Tax=Herbiconiux daphne TaxID=2970914 RepID=A0ABT2H3J2_9MICO|nr:hypothetical protein [Herbiconiux daphne]MCS5734472.1 hypothetical protein [Herbiconiux daphne]
MSPARLRAASAAAVIVVALTVGLAGCAGASSGISAGTGELMQSTVVTAANQAAAGDSAAALATIDNLETQLEQASSKGDVSPSRAATIQQAIDAVRADLLTPAPAATPEPEPEPSDEPVPAPEPVPSDAVTDPAVPSPTDDTVTDDPATDDDGSGDSGNGDSGSGNSNGNSGSNGGGNGNGNNGNGNGNGGSGTDE